MSMILQKMQVVCSMTALEWASNNSMQQAQLQVKPVRISRARCDSKQEPITFNLLLHCRSHRIVHAREHRTMLLVLNLHGQVPAQEVRDLNAANHSTLQMHGTLTEASNTAPTTSPKQVAVTNTIAALRP